MLAHHRKILTSKEKAELYSNIHSILARVTSNQVLKGSISGLRDKTYTAQGKASETLAYVGDKNSFLQ